MIDHLKLQVRDVGRSRGMCVATAAAGGRDTGAPGLRPQRPRYYGAFMPERARRAKPAVGNDVEAVCHRA